MWEGQIGSRALDICHSQRGPMRVDYTCVITVCALPVSQEHYEAQSASNIKFSIYVYMKKYLDLLRERLLHTCKCYWSTSPIFYLLYIETTSSPITHLCFIELVSVCGSTSVPPCIPTQSQHQPLWFSEVFVASLLFLSSIWSLIYLFPLSLPRKPYSFPCWSSSLPHSC